MSRTRDIAALVLAIMICQLAGGIGGFFTASSVSTWYPQLNKPAFTPPGWVFGPVWTILYAMMGVAAWLVWRSGAGEPAVRSALWPFGVQLALNVLWSIVFFGLRNPGWAFAELVILWAAMLATTIQFFGISKAAGGLMIPYQLWVTFAGILNYYLWRLNV